MKKAKRGVEISHWKVEGTDAFAAIPQDRQMTNLIQDQTKIFVKMSKIILILEHRTDSMSR